mmetsp:Transcript_33631/g.104848  ORF Transcript_33631/g.104848 Transcript_33631/m.104848 type:complete len:300 (-) Transcript_33631:1571-2470(-)
MIRTCTYCGAFFIHGCSKESRQPIMMTQTIIRLARKTGSRALVDDSFRKTPVPKTEKRSSMVVCNEAMRTCVSRRRSSFLTMALSWYHLLKPSSISVGNSSHPGPRLLSHLLVLSIGPLCSPSPVCLPPPSEAAQTSCTVFSNDASSKPPCVLETAVALSASVVSSSGLPDVPSNPCPSRAWGLRRVSSTSCTERLEVAAVQACCDASTGRPAAPDVEATVGAVFASSRMVCISVSVMVFLELERRWLQLESRWAQGSSLFRPETDLVSTVRENLTFFSVGSVEGAKAMAGLLFRRRRR